MRSICTWNLLILGLCLSGLLLGCNGEVREPPRAIERPTTADMTPDGTRTPSSLPREEPGLTVPASLPDQENGEVGQLLAEAFSSRRIPRRIEIDHLLTKGDVRELTGFTGVLNVYPLEGQLPAEGYNAMRVGPQDQYGVGLQVWALESSAETSRLYGRLRETYIGAQERSSSIGDRLFRADFGGIRQLVFMSRRHSRVVAVSCNESFCADDSLVERLAQLVFSRL